MKTTLAAVAALLAAVAGSLSLPAASAEVVGGTPLPEGVTLSQSRARCDGNGATVYRVTATDADGHVDLRWQERSNSVRSAIVDATTVTVKVRVWTRWAKRQGGVPAWHFDYSAAEGYEYLRLPFRRRCA